MPDNNRTVTILVQPSRDDTRRVIEFSLSRKPKFNFKPYLLALLTAALCFAASAVFYNLELNEDLSIVCFAAAVVFAAYAVFDGLAKYISAWIAFRGAQKRKEDTLAKLENDPHSDIVKAFVFEEECFAVIVDRERFSAPYGDITFFEEHDDAFFLEYAHICHIIPSRFVSTADYLALIGILKERCKVYKTVKSMRTPDKAQQVEPPVLPEPLALAEYTLSDKEIAQIVKLSPSCFPKSNAARIKATQNNFLNYCKELRIAAYEDCVVLRFSGQDHRFYYGEFEKVTDAEQFVFLVQRNNVWLYPVPVRALADKHAFLRTLSNGVEADKNGSLQAKFERAERPDTPVIEQADMKVGRALLRAQFDGKDILYRRRFGVTELIIDGKVYAQSKKFIERAHLLTAWVDGIEYNAFLNSPDQRSYLTAGSRVLGSKIRLF